MTNNKKTRVQICIFIFVFNFIGTKCQETTVSYESNVEELPASLQAENEKLSMEARDGEDKNSSSTDNREWRTINVQGSTDSYLAALQHSHTSTDSKEGIVQGDNFSLNRPKYIRRHYVQGPVYQGETKYGLPSKQPDTVVEINKSPRILYGSPSDSFTFTPSDSYSLPVQSSNDFNGNPGYSLYNAPQNKYLPVKHYGSPPEDAYGAPTNDFYAPPTIIHPQQAHNEVMFPHGFINKSPMDLPWPFALKLNLYAIGKILLKIVIFQLVAKFIAIICFVFILPLIHGKKDKIKDKITELVDKEDRSFFGKNHMSQERLNLLTSMILNAFEKYESWNTMESKSFDRCDTWSCRIAKISSLIGSWTDSVQLFKSYIEEERLNQS